MFAQLVSVISCIVSALALINFLMSFWSQTGAPQQAALAAASLAVAALPYFVARLLNDDAILKRLDKPRSASSSKRTACRDSDHDER